MNIDFAPLQKAIEPLSRAVEPLWKQMKALFAEHHFLTIVCAFFAVLMTLSIYRFLRSIHPALVGFVLLLILATLILHWIQTRSEPAFLKPFIDGIAPFFPEAPPPPPKG
jgi:MFS superfamily sulfate permease-like transporter